MTIQAALRHVTQYRYDRPIELGDQVIRLRPAAHCRTPLVSYSLSVEPSHFLNWQQDPFGNFLARVKVPEPTASFSVEVNLIAEMIAINPFDFFLEPDAEEYPFVYDATLTKDLYPYLSSDAPTGRLAAWLSSVDRTTPVRTLDMLTSLNQRLATDIKYLVRMEPGVQTPEQTLELGSGSCRDSGWLLVHILRHLGLAARFVSGYLIQLTPDQKSLDGPSGTEVDFCDLHAWAEVYVPGAGWIGLDPTSGLLAGEGHIPLACTPDPRGAAPITGTLEECKVEFDFAMDVTRVRESPRVTLPYTDAQWTAIDQLGEAVDKRLADADVRLTMGGEPTFVSIDDMEADEWNTAATGPNKRRLASQLIERLRTRLAPDGAVHFGQGKWYPGESLPRWSYGLFWREDDEALWTKSQLIATTPGKMPSLERAHSFAEEVASRLGVERDHVMPAYEDPWHYLAAERRLPPDFDPLDAPLADPEARARLARTFEQGLGKPVAFVLPIQAWQSKDARRWHSTKWQPRSEQLFLVPGDSPAGLRLPLDALGPESDDDALVGTAVVPFERAEPLPTRAQQAIMRSHPPTASGEGVGEHSVRTALTVEPREGFVYVFLPPTTTAEDYVELVGAVEAVADQLDQPVRIEGYEPPPDHRVRNIRVTPDPGVIEVNVAPASSWRELVENTELLYEEARQCRLTAEKFMIDGRHTGTGGGNHVVLGGATPADSPFLRQPDLLKSFVGYFNNHPSLSFLFSGMFIGPTSQAPRVDQARDDALYELQIAFDQVPDRDEGKPTPPWLVDRIFRDVLVDVTGNTHRTEICIDKLYSPDSATGRLGLIEFRGFEMPPHARMSLAQGVLIRAMVSRFWDDPYRQPLQAWGTTLHDRFMLPEFVRQDFENVVDDLRRAGMPVDSAWFTPHFEFRFPKLGSIDYQGVHLELRSALEPWHVTGEHGVTGGTARYVDSSVERLEVSVQGFNRERFAVLCNGRVVPLQPTGTAGAFAAGVRYRAWQPPQCMHPTVGVDTPLVFDLFDRWTGRSVAGCSYDVGHPGGRNHETFPINALEAEGRRIGRFSALKHGTSEVTLTAEAPNRAFPGTLDLRSKIRSTM